MIRELIAASLTLVLVVRATPVDNGVEGEAEIECGPTSIAVSFNTRNPFEGHVYVKGLFAAAGCRTDGTNQQRTGHITLPFDQCAVQRTRSLNPKGVFVSTTVIISFHPHFETKVDKAYKIQCFYMEADKTVSTDIEVSMLTTRFQSHNVPMPVCRYQILQNPTGQPVKFAIVGQPLYHKWTCDTETTNTFCMRVYGCFVDDGKGDKVILLDDQGCAQDKYLLGNLEYPTDLMAGKEAHTFKYADRMALFFQCQIEILVKEPNGQCNRPKCAEPQRGKRSAPFLKNYTSSSADALGIVDVSAEISALQESESDSVDDDIRRLALFDDQSGKQQLCFPSSSLGVVAAVFAILFAISLTFAGILVFKRPKML